MGRTPIARVMDCRHFDIGRRTAKPQVRPRTQSTTTGDLNPYQGSFTGGDDAVITKISPQDGSYLYSTYLGDSVTTSRAIAVDSNGNAYVTGYTQSTDFPTVNPYQGSYAGGSWDGYVTKLNAAGDALDYSTYLGGNGDSELWSIAVNHAGNAYIAGQTTATNFPTASPIQSSNAGSSDLTLTELSTSGSSLVYSTYLGGSGTEYASFNTVAVDVTGAAYLRRCSDVARGRLRRDRLQDQPRRSECRLGDVHWRKQ